MILELVAGAAVGWALARRRVVVVDQRRRRARPAVDAPALPPAPPRPTYVPHALVLDRLPSMFRCARPGCSFAITDQVAALREPPPGLDLVCYVIPARPAP